MDVVASRLPSSELIAGWMRAAVPQLDRTQQQVALTLTRLLTTGEPVLPGRVSAELALTQAAVDAAIADLRTVSCDDSGRVTSACGLTLSKTDHQIRWMDAPATQLYTWCAWDPFLLADLVGGPLASMSICPVTKERITVRLDAGGSWRAKPPTTVLSFSLADLSRVGSIGEAFCPLLRFLASSAVGADWTARHDNVILLSIEDAAELARAVNRMCFAAVLGPNG